MIPPAPTAWRKFKSAVGDALVGLVFNACLLATPFAVAAIAEIVSHNEVITFAPTDANRAATRQAINQELARFTEQDPENAKLQWGRLIARELAEDDAAAARGFALAAPQMLSGPEAAKIGRLARGGDDDDYVQSAARLLDPVARDRLLAVGSRRITSLNLLGDANGLAYESERWLAGGAADDLTFRLTGLALALPNPDRSDASNPSLGASVVKAARASAQMSPGLEDYFAQRVEAAVPAAALRRELEAVFQSRDTMVDSGAAALLAFSRAVDRDAYALLAADLSEVAAMAEHVGVAGAAQLLSDADDGKDLARLHLVADAAKERAVAVSKRSPERLVLSTAKGSIVWSEELLAAVAALAVALLGLAWSAYAGLAAALRGTWEAQATPAPTVVRVAAKAEAVRRARNIPPPPRDLAA